MYSAKLAQIVLISFLKINLQHLFIQLEFRFFCSLVCFLMYFDLSLWCKTRFLTHTFDVSCPEFLDDFGLTTAVFRYIALILRCEITINNDSSWFDCGRTRRLNKICLFFKIWTRIAYRQVILKWRQSHWNKSSLGPKAPSTK